MYKIYINENLLCLGEPDEIENLADVTLVIPYFGKRKALLNLADRLEKNTDGRVMAVSSSNLEQLWLDFYSLYRVIPAAGGLVYDQYHKLLLIYRRGFWDLPKGKQDKGESIDQTALREVEEETGISARLGDLAGETWHTYRTKKGKRILKSTTWYSMYATHTELKLQSEEDIEDAQWIQAAEIETLDLPIYRSISDLIQAQEA